jgi:galactofuranosylgalactofuranosylrhamnosyl-N-acetylglucosaminyl-diphospho-decaprenol beta-1,5/1,6-galactofuranosyltransferase
MNSTLKQDWTETGLMDGQYAIQPAIWPEPGVSTEGPPYLRLKGPAGMSLERGGVSFAAGGSATSNGYFNLFNLGKWRDLCGDIPVSLWLRGWGRFQLTIWLAPQDRSWERLYGETISLKDALTLNLDLTAVDHPRAVIFFEMTALADGHLQDFAWTTSAAPLRQPELTLSVTTFRREEAVASTMARFARFREECGFRDHIRMIVVDNGRSVTVAPTDGVTIIPNENLGGAGGFSRGLLEARQSGATHCLFMDDDASIHMGAITRTWWFLAYARDPRTAVAGAMINASHRWQIWENGAIFDRGCKPQYFGCDTREPENVIAMEHETTFHAPPGFYAGWWFFAFPVDQARHMPFPFFVRGDDVSFSLANDFRIVTLPGVASIQESFTDKASPLTWYLDMRSHLAHHLSLPRKAISWGRMQRMFISFYLRTVLRFHYDSLSAVNLAIEDVMKGPQFFADNADMAERRKDLKELATTEAWQPLTHTMGIRHGRASRPLRALLLLTLNGHLLPLSNALGSNLVVEAPHRDNFREIYGAKRITYLNGQRTASYTVHRDRRRFWKESLRLLRNSLKLRRSWRQMHDEWQGRYGELTSEGFWQKKLGL